MRKVRTTIGAAMLAGIAVVAFRGDRIRLYRY